MSGAWVPAPAAVAKGDNYSDTGGIQLNDEQQSSFIRITAFNLEARYPDYKKEFRKKCTQQFTRIELEKIREVIKWLKSKLFI
jgi:hypothetical protein